jgi:outer membrane protein assembly complex protein YaeT
MPGRLTVSDIIIQGNRHVSAEYIRNQMQTRVGKEYLPDQLQEDVRRLYATKQFGNVSASRQDDGTGKVKITIHIVDYPSVLTKVSYQGNIHLSNDDCAELTGVRVGMPCNTTANKVACKRIMARYNEEGRPYASCDLLKGGEPGDTEVIFNITEGPKVRIKDIDFVGNSFVSGSVLRTHIQSSGKFLNLPIGGTYNAAMLDHDLHELIRYYRGFGYHDVRVARELVPTSDGREVLVVFHIHEGVRYRVSDTPQIDGVKSMPREALEANNKMKAGKYYDQATIDGDLTRIKDWLGVGGREARANAVPVFDPERPGIVQVRYEVEERPPARVGQIFVVGNERTRYNVILRQVPLYPGQVLSYPALREAERNLTRLNIFESTPDGSVHPTVSVLENPANPDSPYKDILVSLQEASTGSLMFGLGVNSDSGLTGSIVLNERNFDITKIPTSVDDFLNGSAFRGAGQEFRIEAVPGTQLQRYVVSFREPFLFDTPYSLLLSGYYYQRYFNEYSEDRIGGRITLGRKVSQYWSILGTARLEQVTVYNVQPGAPPAYTTAVGDHFLAGFRLGATRDSRDSVIRPTEGSLLDLGFEYVTGDYNFPLATIDLSNYFTVWQRADGSGRHVLSVHNQFGWAGSNTPVFERYFAGGFRSLRGFQFRGVGPDIDGFKVGGEFMLLNSIEYQVPIRANDQINLVGFVDSGTVTQNINTIDDYRVSVGFGVRFVVPMLGPVPIALDFGFPIIKGPHDNQQVFNFFMGWTR